MWLPCTVSCTVSGSVTRSGMPCNAQPLHTLLLLVQGIRTSHNEFKYADGTPGSRAREVFTSLESGTAGQDCNGHGTAVASTVGGLTYGPAKNASLLAVRSLECLGNGTVSQVSLRHHIGNNCLSFSSVTDCMSHMIRCRYMCGACLPRTAVLCIGVLLYAL